MKKTILKSNLQNQESGDSPVVESQIHDQMVLDLSPGKNGGRRLFPVWVLARMVGEFYSLGSTFSANSYVSIGSIPMLPQ